ncbi:response regulator transcription factor [Variovorax sp. H27-G14]
MVLVVDDAPSSLGMLCDTLEASGYTVLVAADGEAALQRLELVVPDAILLDGLMPGLSGFETCRRIKANPALAHIPVLFMTGLSETAHVVEGFECGGVDYVVKPIRAQEVLARLHTHARNARITRMARDAVDVAGMGVVFVDTRARIAWRSPQAALWLHALEDPVAPGLLPASLAPVLAPGASIAIGTATGMRLSVRNLGAAALGETMLLFAIQRDGSGGPGGQGGASATRLADAALTPRETEVLSWLAKGKTNRDIGEILGTSPRTVNKHLEHIFEKLGVETRAAAAALASSGM